VVSQLIEGASSLWTMEQLAPDCRHSMQLFSAGEMSWAEKRKSRILNS